MIMMTRSAARALAHQTDDDESVVLAVKTPFLSRPVTARLPGSLTLAHALQLVRSDPRLREGESRLVVEQIDREMSARDWHCLVHQPGGSVITAPAGTTLRALATKRLMRTRQGKAELPVVAVDVQAYAPVGAEA